MKNKTTHIKLLSLLLTIVMVLSTAMVFAGEETVTDEGAEPVINTETVDDFSAPEEEPVVVNRSAGDEGSKVGEPSDNEEPPVVEEPSVVSTPAEESISIYVGDVTAFTAELINIPEGTVVDWTWKSENPNVAAVSADGTVSGVAEGTTIITATTSYEGEEYKAEWTVNVAKRAFTNVAPVLSSKKKYSSKDFEGAKDNGYYLDWTQADTTGVKKYQILRNGKVIADNVSTHYEILSPSGTYSYVVRAVGDNGNYIDSNAASISVSGVITETHAYTWWCVAKKKVKVTKTAKGGGTVTTVAKGTKMTAIGRYPTKVKKFKNPKKVQVRLSNGKVGWVPYSSLKGGVKGTYNVGSDYSRSLKEYMVNNSAFSRNTKESSAIRGVKITSGNDTLLWASLYTQRVYTFKKQSGKWVLVHSDRITTGKFSNPTRSSETSGVYTINKKKQGKVWMVQQNGKRYYFTHASYITTGISFHTGTWWASGKKRGTVVASGAPGTYGCIRMYTDGAKYIFANTTLNKTKVVVTRFD